MFILRLWILAFVIFGCVQAAFAKDTYVSGYMRKNGTYVQPHYRSAPDGDVSNNWSTRGNVNPYTGQIGTRDYSSAGMRSYGGVGSSLSSYSQSSSAPLSGGSSQSSFTNLGSNSQPSSPFGNYSQQPSSPFGGSSARVPSIAPVSTPSGATTASLAGSGVPSSLDAVDGGDARERMIIGQRLRKSGLNVDWQKHGLAQMQDLEARVGVSTRLQQLGEDVPWQHKTLPELLDVQARIESSKRLQAAGKRVDWRSLSLGELLNSEGAGAK